MQFLPIFVVLVACLVLEGNCDGIQCYECDNCGDLSDSLLVSCPKQEPAQPSTSTTPSSPSTESLSSSTPPSSTQAPESSAVPTSTQPTEPPISSSSSSSSSLATETTLVPSNDKPSGLSASDYSKIVASILNQSVHNRSSRSVLKAAPSHACYTLNKIDGNDRKVKKGCVEVPEDKSACDVLVTANGPIENCKACGTNKCNGGVTLQFSLATFLFVILITLLNK